MTGAVKLDKRGGVESKLETRSGSTVNVRREIGGGRGSISRTRRDRTPRLLDMVCLDLAMLKLRTQLFDTVLITPGWVFRSA